LDPGVVLPLHADAAGQAGFGVERTAGADVDRGADAARRNRGAAGLVDLQGADAFRCEIREVEGPAGAAREVARLVGADRLNVGGGHRATVQGHQVEAAAEAADRDLRAFTVIAVDGHAGNALERFRQVGVGELADVFRGDRVDDAAVAALDLDRLLDRGANTGDDNF